MKLTKKDVKSFGIAVKKIFEEYENVDEKRAHLKKMNELFALCQKFITENGIGHPECIYQNDHVIQNAYEFIENVCDIVGYATYDEEDDV